MTSGTSNSWAHDTPVVKCIKAYMRKKIHKEVNFIGG